jgi:hypothetical protein
MNNASILDRGVARESVHKLGYGHKQGAAATSSSSVTGGTPEMTRIRRNASFEATRLNCGDRVETGRSRAVVLGSHPSAITSEPPMLSAKTA